MKNILYLILSIFLVACSTPKATITPEATFSPLCPNNNFSDRITDISPNGLWLSERCPSDQGAVLTFSNKETKVVWKLFDRDYIDLEHSYGGMTVIHWSNDSRYAYFYTWLMGSGGYCYHRGHDTGTGVFRFDLQTGKTKEILPPNDTFGWYGFSFSPTDTRLVYGNQARDLMIRDIQTGETIKVAHKIDFNEGGGYVWSPDGLQFVYSTARYPSNNVGAVDYTLRLVDAKTGVEQILFESKTNCYLAQKWEADNSLQIEYYDKNYNSAIMEYDVNSNTIIR